MKAANDFGICVLESHSKSREHATGRSHYIHIQLYEQEN